MQNHNQLIKDIKEDPSHFNSLLHKHTQSLKEQFPDQDDSWVYYWASRLSLLGDDQEVSILMDTTNDPGLITITIFPDYGS